jgi:hypothetical protein
MAASLVVLSVKGCFIDGVLNWMRVPVWWRGNAILTGKRAIAMTERVRSKEDGHPGRLLMFQNCSSACNGRPHLCPPPFFGTWLVLSNHSIAACITVTFLEHLPG